MIFIIIIIILLDCFSFFFNFILYPSRFLNLRVELALVALYLHRSLDLSNKLARPSCKYNLLVSTIDENDKLARHAISDSNLM